MYENPVIIHIPHSSTFIPQYEREKILLLETDLQKELLIMTDRYVAELFDVVNCEKHINDVSRLVMDPERFRADEDEEMSQYGMGAIYTKTSDGKPLRAISSEEREEMLTRYYDPYHSLFTQKVEKILEAFGRCIIIDAHSFSSIPLLHEKDKSQPRPDICIGYENFHIIPGLPREVYEFLFWGEDMYVKYNQPFSGSIVPSRYYQIDKGVTSIMIEVKRSIYMDEATGKKLQGFYSIKDMIERLINYIIECI